MKNFIIFILSIALCSNGNGQKIQYSKSTLQVDDPKEMQFVANINGYHHLLRFSANKKAYVYIYDRQLLLTQKKDLGFTTRDDCNIKVLSFSDHYYVYVHKLKSSSHELWKIDAGGIVTSLSQKLREIVDSLFGNYEATLQLVNLDEHLYLLANTSYNEIKNIKSTIIKLDGQLNPLEVRKVLYPFDGGKEMLLQTELSRNALFVLKNSRDKELETHLDLIKIDQFTGELVTSSFSSSTLLHRTPAFVIDPNDSTILIYSLAGERSNIFESQSPLFISRLNYSLQELVPVTLFRSQFNSNTAINYFLLKGTSPAWIKTGQPAMSLRAGDKLAAVRLTLLDEHFKMTDDTLIANKKFFEVQPLPFAQFLINNKACLFLVQNLTRKRKSLLMITANEKDRIETTDIRVFDKYDCMLSQMHFIKDYVIFPYLYRNEMGLVKILINKTTIL